jgi:hypothetical protein
MHVLAWREPKDGQLDVCIEKPLAFPCVDSQANRRRSPGMPIATRDRFLRAANLSGSTYRGSRDGFGSTCSRTSSSARTCKVVDAPRNGMADSLNVNRCFKSSAPEPGFQEASAR